MSASLAVFSTLSAVSGSALAGGPERRFAFAYESGVVAPGEAQLETWSTARVGRVQYYSALDQRLGFALGLAPNLQTAAYLDFSAVAEGVRLPSQITRTHFAQTQDDLRFVGVTSETRYKLLDSLADPLGAAVLIQGSYGPRRVDVGGRLIIDKQVYNLLLAANVAGLQRWELALTSRDDWPRFSDADSTQHFEADLAFGYFFMPQLTAGIEALNVTRANAGDIAVSSIYVGPSVAYAAERYWLVLNAAPQVFAFKGETSGHLDLARGERVWARLLIGFRI
ncbi:MAG: hypothetical protein ACOY0T_25695 [Myxococcota bacterium]